MFAIAPAIALRQLLTTTTIDGPRTIARSAGVQGPHTWVLIVTNAVFVGICRASASAHANHIDHIAGAIAFPVQDVHAQIAVRSPRKAQAFKVASRWIVAPLARHRFTRPVICGGLHLIIASKFIRASRNHTIFLRSDAKVFVITNPICICICSTRPIACAKGICHRGAAAHPQAIHGQEAIPIAVQFLRRVNATSIVFRCRRGIVASCGIRAAEWTEITRAIIVKGFCIVVVGQLVGASTASAARADWQYVTELIVLGALDKNLNLDLPCDGSCRCELGHQNTFFWSTECRVDAGLFQSRKSEEPCPSSRIFYGKTGT